MKLHNFSAGPCILPKEVILKASEALLDFDKRIIFNRNISQKQSFCRCYGKARSLALELLGLEGKGYKALFLQGGASMQFLHGRFKFIRKKSWLFKYRDLE